MRERLKRFSFGISGIEREKWCASGVDVGCGEGASASVMTDADSARSLSPIL